MIWGDYHTHTRNSDGKKDLIDTLIQADKIGLKEVGISDHGLKHIVGGMHFRDIEKMRTQIADYREQFNVKCLLSVEANIFSADGSIDLTPSEWELFDYVVAGYHKGAMPKTFADAFRYNLPALWTSLTKSQSDFLRKKYTPTFVKAIKSGRINVISHLNYGVPVFVSEVGKAACDYDVYVELSGKHFDITDEELLTLYDMNVKFLANSDAHSPERLGDVDFPVKQFQRLNLDLDRIANWQKLPTDLRLKR